MPLEEQFDLAFIDADKPSYASYYDEIIPRLRSGGLLMVDNVLWGGSVVDPQATDENTTAIRAFNDKVAADERVESVILAISDGVTVAACEAIVRAGAGGSEADDGDEDQLGSAASIASTSSGASGVTIGENRAMMSPVGETRNFSKFHRMSPV